LNIRDLQYLVAVYDLNSFSKAADRCFVSQPTLSGQLKKLEDELGASLMERSTRKVLFTPLGKRVVAEARSLLNTVQNIKQLAKQTDDPMAGDFHIGLIPTVGPFLLPKIIPLINQSFPRMNLYLHELQTEVLIERLLKGDLDAAILAKLDWNHPIQEIPLYLEELKLAVSANDPISEGIQSTNRSVSRSVLEDRTVLMLEDGHCLRDQALGVCFAEGAKEDRRFQATSMDTLLHMVATGVGITLVPELAAQEDQLGVNFFSFSEPVPRREIIMVSRSNSARESSLEQISSLIRDTINPEPFVPEQLSQSTG